MVLGWISPSMDSGAAVLRALTWTSGSSIPMRLQTEVPAFQTAIGNMKMKKKRAYEQRLLDVEHSSFTPLVFSTTGGMARQATTFYKRLTAMCSLISGTTRTAQHCAGYAVAFHSCTSTVYNSVHSWCLRMFLYWSRYQDYSSH